jgi:hypothetical protein
MASGQEGLPIAAGSAGARGASHATAPKAHGARAGAWLAFRPVSVAADCDELRLRKRLAETTIYMPQRETHEFAQAKRKMRRLHELNEIEIIC